MASALLRTGAMGVWAWVLLASPLPLLAQSESPADRIRLVVRDASRALQAGNAPLFMAAFDRHAFPGFPALREQVTALAAHRRIASSVESRVIDTGPEHWSVRVDWLLEMTPKLDPGPLERRHRTLLLRMVNRGKQWKIVDLEPQDFFSTLRQTPP